MSYLTLKYPSSTCGVGKGSKPDPPLLVFVAILVRFLYQKISKMTFDINFSDSKSFV